ncbi:MAG: DUF2442 domain-containing protein [Acidobacteriaceae bacterium]
MAAHKVITSDEEIDRAIERGASLRDEPRVVKVEYRPGRGLNLLVLSLSDGHRHVVPVEDVEGLKSATREEINEVGILGRGTGLHWPALDLDLYVPDLLLGIYGTRRWMAEMGRRGGAARSAAKRKASRANGLRGGRPKKALAS